MKTRLVIVLSLMLFAVFVRSQLDYPHVWDEIHVGMTRQDVYQLVGPPGQDWGDLKGAFWVRAGIAGRQELWVYFEDEKVTNLSVKRYIGTDRTFWVQYVRFEPPLK